MSNLDVLLSDGILSPTGKPIPLELKHTHTSDNLNQPQTSTVNLGISPSGYFAVELYSYGYSLQSTYHYMHVDTLLKVGGDVHFQLLNQKIVRGGGSNNGMSLIYNGSNKLIVPNNTTITFTTNQTSNGSNGQSGIFSKYQSISGCIFALKEVM